MITVVLHKDCLDTLLFRSKQYHKTIKDNVVKFKRKNNNNNKIKTVIVCPTHTHALKRLNNNNNDNNNSIPYTYILYSIV